MDIHRKARHILIVGQSGTGKTTCGIRFILPTFHERIVIGDHEGEFSARLKVPLNLTWEDFYSALETQRVACLDITEVGDAEESFDTLCQEVLSLSKTVFQPKGIETLLVVDEVQKYTSSHNVPPNFKNALETGRKWGLDTLSLSQRPNGIHPSIREQFTEIFFFRMQDPNSHRFGEYFGISPEIQSSLADGEFVYMNMKTGRKSKGKIFEGAKPKPSEIELA